MRLSHRPAIDGLRAIAILIIFFSHFPNLPIQSGGVNIFFVISGFLITRIIYTKYPKNIIQFYSSRIRSLYPQLIFVSSAIFISYFFFGESENFKTLYESCENALLGIINIYFIRTATIYGQESFLNPFSPFWAFSVIIQFYIIYPFLLKFLIKTRVLKITLFKKFAIATVLFYILYFLISSFYPNNAYTNFYSLLTRFWQFLLGASLFFYLLENKPKDFSKNISVIISILLLVVWQFYPSLNENFNLKTLIISMFAVGVIYSSRHKNILNKILSFNLLINFGKISYPFYLWHMAVIYFFYLYFIEINLVHILMITLITTILSVGSIKLNNLAISFKKISFFSFLLIICITAIMHINYAFIQGSMKNLNFLNKQKILFEQKNPDIGPTYNDLVRAGDGLPCFDDGDNNELRECSFNIQGKTKVILLGTSHLAIFAKPLVERLLPENYHLQAIFKGYGCPYITNFHNITRRKDCNEERMNKIKKELMKEKAIIIISQRWPLYLSGDFFTNQNGYVENKEKMILRNKNGMSVYDGFYDSINELINYGHKILLIYPIPEFAVNIPDYYRKQLYKLDSFAIPYDLYQKRTSESFRLLDSFGKINIERIYPHDYMCDKNLNKCYSKINNKILYSDDDHLNINGVSLMLDDILKKLDKLND